MATPGLKSFPLQARKLIEQLREENSALKRDNAILLTDLERERRADPVQAPLRVMLEPGTYRVQPARAADRPALASKGLAAAVARGEAARVEWVKSGEIIPAKTLASVWGLTPQALGPAGERGEVFAVVVKRQRFYPKEFLELEREDVGAVSKALGMLSPSQKLIFWKRSHGALGGKTVLQSLGRNRDGSQIDRVTRLAHAWAAEARAGSDVTEAA